VLGHPNEEGVESILIRNRETLQKTFAGDDPSSRTAKTISRTGPLWWIGLRRGCLGGDSPFGLFPYASP
jgi:hypothetical protein